MQSFRTSVICALGEDRAIGLNNALIWRISDDLRRFKRLTMGHPVIMGRKTHESIGRPLPGRENIVITRNRDYTAEGCTVAHSVTDAIALAAKADKSDTPEIFIIGGEEIYRETMPCADRLYLTLIRATADSADAYFPDYSGYDRIIEKEDHDQDALHYSYITLERSDAGVKQS